MVMMMTTECHNLPNPFVNPLPPTTSGVMDGLELVSESILNPLAATVLRQITTQHFGSLIAAQLVAVYENKQPIKSENRLR